MATAVKSGRGEIDNEAESLADFVPGHDIDCAAIAGLEARLRAVQPRTPLRMPLDEGRIRQLLARIGNGDADAFTALYDETSPYLNAVLLRLLRDREQASEALQDCYIRIWRRSCTYAPERGDAAAWLIGIARYRAIDLVRGRQGPCRTAGNPCVRSARRRRTSTIARARCHRAHRYRPPVALPRCTG